MNMLAREPLNLMNRVQEDFNQMSRWLGGRFPSSWLEEESNIATSEWMPSVDIQEEDDKFIINADIPGVDPKDIEVSMDQGMLSIQGERKTESKTEKNGYRRAECSYGLFNRRFSLPMSANPDKITAKGKNGVLQISIEKRETTKPKRIQVKE
jgi:HSP20 family protein